MTEDTIAIRETNERIDGLVEKTQQAKRVSEQAFAAANNAQAYCDKAYRRMMDLLRDREALATNAAGLEQQEAQTIALTTDVVNLRGELSALRSDFYAFRALVAQTKEVEQPPRDMTTAELTCELDTLEDDGVGYESPRYRALLRERLDRAESAVRDEIVGRP